jgi:uncharacterized membrane protein YphA (DoxX/SURF4 family)
MRRRWRTVKAWSLVQRLLHQLVLEPGKGRGFEMNLALVGMALAVLVGGAGALSIDGWLYPR